MANDVSRHRDVLEVISSCKGSVVESDELTRPLSIGDLGHSDGGVSSRCHCAVCRTNGDVIERTEREVAILVSVCRSVVD